MKGNAKIIDALNKMLAYEMTASDQYFVHAHVYHDMGLLHLYDRIYHEHQEELTHAKVLIERSCSSRARLISASACRPAPAATYRRC